MTRRRGFLLFAVIGLALGEVEPLTAAAPTASFTFAPAAPAVGQAVAFTDTCTGSPTSWAWNVGDGGTSATRNPSHAYAKAGTFTVSLKVSNAGGSATVSRAVTVTQAASIPFDGSIVLGSPTTTAIKANVFSPDRGGTVYLAYGRSTGTYPATTAAEPLQAATPLELTLDGLAADAQYYYRLYFKASGGGAFSPTSEYTFHTARPAGSTFTFTIQGDSHPDREKTQFDPNLSARTLLTAAAYKPDFHITIGDDFSVDTLDPSTINAALVTGRCALQRPCLGLIG
jgi:PKD repeat protein